MSFGGVALLMASMNFKLWPHAIYWIGRDYSLRFWISSFRIGR